MHVDRGEGVFIYLIGLFIFSIAVINECLDGNGGCSQICTDTLESYTCSCIDGYVLEEDRQTCAFGK